MASISEKSGKFSARVRIKGYPTQCKAFHRKADAIAWGRSVEADMQAGRWKASPQASSVPVVTLGDALDLYMERITPTKRGARQEANVIKLIRKADSCNASAWIWRGVA